MSTTRLTSLVSGRSRRIPTPTPGTHFPTSAKEPASFQGPGPETLPCPLHGQVLRAPPPKEIQKPDAPPTATATSLVQAPSPLLWAAATLSYLSPSLALTTQTPPRCRLILGRQAARFLENLSGSAWVPLTGVGLQRSSDLMLTAVARLTPATQASLTPQTYPPRHTLPQGLCTSCSLRLEGCFPSVLEAHSHSLHDFAQCRPLEEAYPDNPFTSAQDCPGSPIPRFSLLLLLFFFFFFVALTILPPRCHSSLLIRPVTHYRPALPLQNASSPRAKTCEGGAPSKAGTERKGEQAPALGFPAPGNTLQ